MVGLALPPHMIVQLPLRPRPPSRPSRTPTPLTPRPLAHGGAGQEVARVARRSPAWPPSSPPSPSGGWRNFLGISLTLKYSLHRRGRKVSGHESPFYSSTSRPTHHGHLQRQLTTSTSSVQMQKSFSPSPSDYFQKTLLSTSTSKKNMSNFEDNNQV